MHGIANIRTVFFALLSFASLVCAQNPTLPNTPPTPKRSVPVDPNKYCVVINGAGGDAAYASQFESWTTELTSILNARFGFGPNHLKVLSEKSSDGLHATADNVKQTFTLLRSELQPENVLFVFFIGHGSYDGKESKFNLVGPDLSATEYGTLLTSLPTKRVVVFNMSSASGEFARSLSAKGRIVITATRNGQETNATRFAGFLIEALKATDADTDQDGHVSVLEAFVYANRLTSEFYARAGRLATEHALLEDNGDGIGREKAENGEGLLARATYFDSLSYEQAAANAATAKLLRERARLEGEIEQLIGQKANLSEAVYETTLEKLFIELAKINRSIKQAGS